MSNKNTILIQFSPLNLCLPHYFLHCEGGLVAVVGSQECILGGVVVNGV